MKIRRSITNKRISSQLEPRQRRKKGRTDGTLHGSDIRVTTAGVDTHFYLVITTSQLADLPHPACASFGGDAAKKTFNTKSFSTRVAMISPRIDWCHLPYISIAIGTSLFSGKSSHSMQKVIFYTKLLSIATPGSEDRMGIDSSCSYSNARFMDYTISFFSASQATH